MSLLAFEMGQAIDHVKNISIWNTQPYRESSINQAVEQLSLIKGRVLQMELELARYRKLLGERLADMDTGDMLGVDES